MKRVVFVVFAIILTMMIGCKREGDVITKDGINYKVLEDGKTLEVSGYKSIPENGEVVIPEMVDGMKVVKVGKEAFYECNDLTSVKMPMVETVGEWAFYECKALTSVQMPVVETVGEWAFYECKALTSVQMPKTGSCFKLDSFKECPWQPSEKGVTSSCQE